MPVRTIDVNTSMVSPMPCNALPQKNPKLNKAFLTSKLLQLAADLTLIASTEEQKQNSQEEVKINIYPNDDSCCSIDTIVANTENCEAMEESKSECGSMIHTPSRSPSPVMMEMEMPKFVIPTLTARKTNRSSPFSTIAGSASSVHDPIALRNIESIRTKMQAYFSPFVTNGHGGIPVIAENFKLLGVITKSLFGLPSHCALLLARRVIDFERFQQGLAPQTRQEQEEEVVTLSSLIAYYVAQKFPQCDATKETFQQRLFRLLVASPVDTSSTRGIRPLDFVPVLEGLIAFYPESSLGLLTHVEEIRHAYFTTVLARIFYTVNSSRTGVITWREFYHSALPLVLNKIEDNVPYLEGDRLFFSYEEFTYLYQSFRDLDEDHDNILSPMDLTFYDGGVLSDNIIDRIFQAGERAFSDGCQGFVTYTGSMYEQGMTYADFIYFTLAYVENNTDTALRYWFKVLDLDGNGRIDIDLLHHWYNLQVKSQNRSVAVAACAGMKAKPSDAANSLVSTEQFMSHSLDAMFSDVYSHVNHVVGRVHAMEQSNEAIMHEKKFLTLEDFLSSTRGAVVAIVEILTNAHKFSSYYQSGGGNSDKGK